MQNLEVGQIVNTFGIKGFVKVNPFVDDLQRFDKLKKVYIKKKQELQKFEIEQVKYQKNIVLVKFKGIENIEEAEKLKNCYIEIDREDAIPLDEDTYFIADLLGSDVYTDEGKELGKLVDVFNTGSNDIYVVKDELGKSVLLPAIAEVVKDVNVQDKKIVVHLLEGLI